jgi:hypothetical protein
MLARDIGQHISHFEIVVTKNVKALETDEK